MMRYRMIAVKDAREMGESFSTGDHRHVPRIILILCLFLGFLCPLAHGNTLQLVPGYDEVAVVRAEFGLLDFSDSGVPRVLPSTGVPWKEGQGYGWAIQLATTKLKVKWREELLLPAVPQIWGVGEEKGKHTISLDRKLCVTEQEGVADRGLIFNAWEVAPGDPRGRYIIRIFVNDRLVRIFEFDIE